MNSVADTVDERSCRVREILARKVALRRWYLEMYETFQACSNRCPVEGLTVELGSGGGFAKEVVGGLITTDVQPGPGIDQVVDATALPFSASSVRLICMLNAFHHIPDVAAFLSEAVRVLVPGGRVMIVDQHLGALSRPIYRFGHDEPCDPQAESWSFEKAGAQTANGALAHIVFCRDRARFTRDFPELSVVGYRPHSPLRYWLTGGLRRWSLLPRFGFSIATGLDRVLARLTAQSCSFVDVELCRTA